MGEPGYSSSNVMNDLAILASWRFNCSMIEPLIRQSGWLEISKLTVSAVEIDEFLIFAARTDHQ